MDSTTVTRLGAALALVALSACATAPRPEAPPAPLPPAARGDASCVSLAGKLSPGMALDVVNASLGAPDTMSKKVCGNAADASFAECLHATYACLGDDGRPTELWVFFDGDGAGAWKVRYFGSHGHTTRSQGTI